MSMGTVYKIVMSCCKTSLVVNLRDHATPSFQTLRSYESVKLLAAAGMVQVQQQGEKQWN